LKTMKGLGVIAKDNKVYLLNEFLKKKKPVVLLAESDDGKFFQVVCRGKNIVELKGLDSAKSAGFRSSSGRKDFFLTFNQSFRGKKSLIIARSKDLVTWKNVARISDISEAGVIIPDFTFKKEYVLYFGEKNIGVAFSKDLKKWRKEKNPVLKPRSGRFQEKSLEICDARVTDEGILVSYFVTLKNDLRSWIGLGLVLFDRNDPTKVIWHSKEAVWEEPEDWRKGKMSFIGSASFAGDHLIYWSDKKGTISSVRIPGLEYFKDVGIDKVPIKLRRFAGNPIIVPISVHGWESRATFNPAAVYEKGRVHLIYRAIGGGDVSVFGYASSTDGLFVNQRLSRPAYVPREKFEGLSPDNHGDRPVPGVIYASGGGCRGGCEDPRLTVIDGRVYMVFTAFNGWDSVRLALTSIALEDFLNHRWHWEKPVLISPPGEIHKNWVIFPEKIRGKFAILHGIFPEIAVDYFDGLDGFTGEKWIRSCNARPLRPGKGWDSWLRGAGPPPIKTKSGWLLLYHAMDHRDPNRYKLGAMILDLKNPTKILYRSKKPILEPDEHYENHGFKAGVVYSCGAVVKDDRLIVYYGGADMVTCVATANLDEFVKALVKGKEPVLEAVKMANA
jgi:beta-1,2-mannobiose phosphorylase / 1,2-beta-oligomannan phosphorylase